MVSLISGSEKPSNMAINRQKEVRLEPPLLKPFQGSFSRHYFAGMKPEVIPFVAEQCL
jgi:hypothetical protein